MCVCTCVWGMLTHGSQHVPEVVLADDTVPVLVDDREGLRREEEEESQCEEETHQSAVDYRSSCSPIRPSLFLQPDRPGTS